MVAILAGTRGQVIEHVSKIDSKKRQAAIEITLKIWLILSWLAKKCFQKPYK
jgi:hypothetical protein